MTTETTNPFAAQRELAARSKAFFNLEAAIKRLMESGDYEGDDDPRDTVIYTPKRPKS